MKGDTKPSPIVLANNALLESGVTVRVWIREQRKIKRRSKPLLSLWWQTWTSLPFYHNYYYGKSKKLGGARK